MPRGTGTRGRVPRETRFSPERNASINSLRDQIHTSLRRGEDAAFYRQMLEVNIATGEQEIEQAARSRMDVDLTMDSLQRARDQLSNPPITMTSPVEWGMNSISPGRLEQVSVGEGMSFYRVGQRPSFVAYDAASPSLEIAYDYPYIIREVVGYNGDYDIDYDLGSEVWTVRNPDGELVQTFSEDYLRSEMSGREIPEEWLTPIVVAPRDETVYTEATTENPLELFTNEELISTEQTMYLINKNISQNFRGVFGKALTQASTSLSLINAVIHNDSFPEIMAEYRITQRAEVESYILNTLNNHFPHHVEAGLNLHAIRDGNNTTLSSMINIFLRRNYTDTLIDSCKFVIASRRFIVFRISHMKSQTYNYHMLYLESPISKEEMAQSPKLAGCAYVFKNNCDEFYPSEYGCQSTYDITDESELKKIFNMKSITSSEVSIFKTKAVVDYLDQGVKIADLPAKLMSAYKLKMCRGFNLEEMRLSEATEKPQVMVGCSVEMSFRSKKGLDILLSLVLKSYPLVIPTVAHHLRIHAPSIQADGTFSESEELYKVDYYFHGHTLYVECRGKEANIFLAFLFDDMVISLSGEELDMLTDIAFDEEKKLGLDSIKEFKKLQQAIDNNTGKIARAKYATNLRGKDKFFIDENFKSFFDGIRSTLSNKVATPSLNGIQIESRSFPISHAKAIAKDSHLLELITKITSKNYYNGGICVEVRRSK